MSKYEYLTAIYSLTGEMPHRVHVEAYSFLQIVGDVTGLTILDAACGHGLYSRILKQNGAAKVVGIDVSESLIQLARYLETQRPFGIEYQVLDVVAAPPLGPFDLVAAVWLTPYAQTQEHLAAMAQNLHGQLRPGGRLVGVAANPALDLTRGNYTRYGMTVHASNQRGDGDEYTVDMHLDPPFSISGRFWHPKTIEHALAATGFRDIAWHRPAVSREGVEQFGADHWQPLLENSNMLFFSAYA